jgi:predicted phage baseplate assembly protein
LEINVDTGAPAAPWRLRKNLIYGRRALTDEQLDALVYQDRIGSTLAFSRGPDHDYMIETDDQDVTEVVFGDGQYGQIPGTGARIVANYRVGGGTAGNVGAGQIKGIAKAPQLQLLGAKVVNRDAASGGAERETIAQAVKYGPTVFRSMQRAVTAQDYVTQARLFPGVSKARAESPNWNIIKLYIAPTGSGEFPTDTLKKELLTYFEDKRMLTTFIQIENPDYVHIEVRVELNVLAYFLPEKVRADAENTIKQLFDFEKVDFQQVLYLSKVYEALEAVDGVNSVFVSRFRVANSAEEIPRDGRIALKANEIPVLNPEDIQISEV